VTLTGTVDSSAQKARMLQLARETAGVTSVVDRLQVRH
jgi:osmotically-inducible protein OsmY